MYRKLRKGNRQELTGSNRSYCILKRAPLKNKNKLIELKINVLPQPLTPHFSRLPSLFPSYRTT